MLLRFRDTTLLIVRADSAKSLIVDQTHLVLASGKLVLQKHGGYKFDAGRP